MNRRLLVIVGGLVLVALLVPLLQDVVRVGLVTPLLYAGWFAHLLFASVPQRAGWFFLVAIAALIAWRSVRPQRQLRARGRAPEPVQPGRVATWSRLIQQAERDPYAAWRLSQRLAQLAQEVLSHEERLSQREVRQQLLGGALDLPPEIRAALRVGIEAYRPPQRRRPLPQFSRASRKATDDDAARVVAFLEARLHVGQEARRDD